LAMPRYWLSLEISSANFRNAESMWIVESKWAALAVEIEFWWTIISQVTYLKFAWNFVFSIFCLLFICKMEFTSLQI
jgi:hypothetical protein